MGDGRSARDLDVRLERYLPTRNENECWLWTGGLTPNGYGIISTWGKLHPAHRVVYEIEVGEIPTGLTLDHECHNLAAARGECVGGNSCIHRRCCNPAHLFPRTPHENQLRGNRNANSTKSHCVHGHPYDEENTYFYKASKRDGGEKIYRGCRTCRSESKSRQTQRIREARELAAQTEQLRKRRAA